MNITLNTELINNITEYVNQFELQPMVRYNPVTQHYLHTCNLGDSISLSQQANEMLQVINLLALYSYSTNYSCFNKVVEFKYGLLKTSGEMLVIELDFNIGVIKVKKGNMKSKITFERIYKIVSLLEFYR